MTYEAVFPAALQPTASALLQALSGIKLARPKQGFWVYVQREYLSAPGRIYCPSDKFRSVMENATDDARILMLCLGTRHSDGYLREECVRKIIAAERPWTIPFVIKLLGEHVIAIVEVIADAVPQANGAQIAEFVHANPNFVAATRQQATRYWACYHRSRFPRLQAYPGIVALDAIKQLAIAP